MNNSIKEKILNIKSVEELEKFENEMLEEYRNDFYNQLLEDNEIENHLADVFQANKESLPNLLVINDSPPLDDFNSTQD